MQGVREKTLICFFGTCVGGTWPVFFLTLLLDFIIAFFEDFGICYKKKCCWFNHQIEVEITYSDFDPPAN